MAKKILLIESDTALAGTIAAALHARGAEIAVARDAGVGTLALYHHAPHRTDDEQDAILASYTRGLAGKGPALVAAREGMALTVGAPPG